MSEAVRRPDHELVERVARVQGPRGPGGLAGRRWRARSGAAATGLIVMVPGESGSAAGGPTARRPASTPRPGRRCRRAARRRARGRSRLGARRRSSGGSSTAAVQPRASWARRGPARRAGAAGAGRSGTRCARWPQPALPATAVRPAPRCVQRCRRWPRRPDPGCPQARPQLWRNSESRRGPPLLGDPASRGRDPCGEVSLASWPVRRARRNVPPGVMVLKRSLAASTPRARAARATARRDHNFARVADVSRAPVDCVSKLSRAPCFGRVR